MKFETLLIHGGATSDPYTKAVNIPIYQTSTYRQSELYQPVEYEYSRTKNPTRNAVETLIAQLEGGKAGFAFSSGMAAISTVLSLFEQGDIILISDNLYGGTYRVLEKVFHRFGIQYIVVDTTDVANIEKAIHPDVKAILVESPTNPLLAISDLKAISELARKHGVLHIVDNTFMTPYFQKPLELGADVVLHSGTKYLGGHSDLIAGLVVVKDDTLAQRVSFLQNAMGAVLGPMDSFLLVRGIKTLGLRMERHQENTLKLVSYLQEMEEIKKLYHPSLLSFKNHLIGVNQSSGFVPLVSFSLDERVNLPLFFKQLKVITLGESLGGVESLICHPASMTHASYPKEMREQVGITDNLIRLSVGIEHVDDIYHDLLQAIEVASK